MKKISAVLAVALCCAGPALAAKPPKPVKPNPNLTIQASATSVTFGRSVTLSGTTKNIAAGTSVELQQNPYPYSGFKPAGKTAVVDPITANQTIITGPNSRPIVPEPNRWSMNSPSRIPSDSGTVFVRARLRVAFSVSDSTPKRGAMVRFFGTAAPAHDGKPVLIQKKTATGYKTVATTALLHNGTASSKYSKKLRIRRSARYRVVVESLDQDHDNGTSRSVSLRVH